MESHLDHRSTTVHTSLLALGYDAHLATAFTTFATSRPDLALVPARVVAHLGARLALAGTRAEHGELAGRLAHQLTGAARPTVGDWVAATDGELAVIHHVLPRRTALVRRAAGRRGEAQAVAANADVFLVVTSANRDANPRRLERYLAAVWDSGARPAIVVNKIDLCEPAHLDEVVAALAASAPGVAIHPVSAARGDGLDALAPYLGPGSTVALVGSSGVGKSSLLNRLAGRDRQVTLPIDGDERGRHATTVRELFALPSGGLAIDTAGMRELGLVEDDGGLDAGFADVAALAAGCRFADCRHRGEPGCAVAAALEDGTLDPARVAALDKLEREVAFAERRRDPAAAGRSKARWKAIHVAQRARAKVDPKLRR